METMSFKIFITKSPDAAAMIAKGLWNEPIKDGEKNKNMSRMHRS